MNAPKDGNGPCLFPAAIGNHESFATLAHVSFVVVAY